MGERGAVGERGRQRLRLGGDLRLLLVTGLLGGFTTFSAFSLETGLLWERGGWWPATARERWVWAGVAAGAASVVMRFTDRRSLSG